MPIRARVISATNTSHIISHVNVWISLKCMNQPRSQLLFSLTWLPIEVVLRMKMMKILVCRVWTWRNIAAFVVNFHCATNAHFHEKTTKVQFAKLGKFVAYCLPCSKEDSVQGTQYSTHVVGGENAFAFSGLKAPLIFTVSLTKERALF